MEIILKLAKWRLAEFAWIFTVRRRWQRIDDDLAVEEGIGKGGNGEIDWGMMTSL